MAVRYECDWRTCFHEGAIKNRSKYQNVAGVVNLAFACELFLKCLLNLEGSTTLGHKLRDLWSVYNRISPDDALVIKNAVMHSMVADLSFEEMLQDDSNVFYNYRYLYDPGRIDEINDNPLRPQFLRVFCCTLCTYVKEKAFTMKNRAGPVIGLLLDR